MSLSRDSRRWGHCDTELLFRKKKKTDILDISSEVWHKISCENVKRWIDLLFLSAETEPHFKTFHWVNVALRRYESWGQGVLRFSCCITSAFPLWRTSERKVSHFSSGGEPFNSKKQGFNGAPCTTVHSIHNGEDRVTCYFRPNMTANNCLTNICMPPFVLLNTLLSNWAPRSRHYFKLFADSTVGWNKTIINHISHHYGVLRDLRFRWKLRFWPASF